MAKVARLEESHEERIESPLGGEGGVAAEELNLMKRELKVINSFATLQRPFNESHEERIESSNSSMDLFVATFKNLMKRELKAHSLFFSVFYSLLESHEERIESSFLPPAP